ncbi:MAG: class I SAM-dependent rRNA methyltransferase [Candidatus Promineifilaceae bacterium]
MSSSPPPITASLRLKAKRDRPVRNRHPWIFSGAIQQVNGDPQHGDLVAIESNKGEHLGTAYYNVNSQIRGRLLTWEDEPIDADWWRRKIRAAAGRRALLNLNTNAVRLINAEADQLPGLVVDRYGDYLVMQCLTWGIDRRKELIAEILADEFRPKAIIERSDADVRRKEGLRKERGVLFGEDPPEQIVVQENGANFGVNLLHGHKTGLYLDQRRNRQIVGEFSAEKDVLNVFSYTGGFGISAALAGAKSVVNIDSSIFALEQAERNFALNGFEDESCYEFIAANAFELLRDYRDAGQKFDIIILDPPKFAHSPRDVDKASRGYKDLNWLAMRMLRPNGLLATFSCSGAISAELFQKIVFGAAVDAKRSAQIVQPLTQASDHPTLITFPESFYLKGLLCRVW